MALAGLSVGNGRAAYADRRSASSPSSLGIAMVVVCWLWAGRIMRLPEEERVFYE